MMLLSCFLFLSACNQISFKVNFIIENEVYYTINTIGNETLMLPDDPTKDGYIFDGWYWDNNVWQRPFTVNSLLNEPLKSNISVYAKWDTDNTPKGTQANFAGFTKEDETTYSISVSNTTETLNMSNIVQVSNTSSWKLTTDIQGINSIPSKIATLEAGENIFYVLVVAGNNDVCLYTLKIRRRPKYLVTFNTNQGTYVSSQSIEEGYCAKQPDIIPKKTGCIFNSWDFDFNKKIYRNTQINAKWDLIQYSITYHYTGDLKNENPTSYTIEDDQIKLISPQKTNYNYGYWYDRDGKIFTYIDGKFANNIELFDFYSNIELESIILTKEKLINGEWKKAGLATDIDLQGIDWEPLGSKEKPFDKVLDGGGHSISNFNISNRKYIGFIGYAVSAYISNLNLKEFLIQSEDVDSEYVGSIIAYSVAGALENCSSNGKIIIKTNNSLHNIFIGGLVGNDSSYIKKCYSNVDMDISLNGNNQDALNSYIGGISGKNYSIEESFSQSKISVKDSGSMNVSFIGGLSGASWKINESNYSGEIKTSFTKYLKKSGFDGGVSIGGICAENAILSRCKSSATINVDNINYITYIGGLCATNQNNMILSSANSIIRGIISVPSLGTIIGGLCAENSSNISRCFSVIDLDIVIQSNKNDNEVIIGGLVANNAEKGEIDNCFSKGSIILRSGKTNIYLGGLIGKNNEIITKCYSGVNVDIKELDSQTNSIGGLIGLNTCSIIDCYAYGNLIATNSNTTNIGYLFGNNQDISMSNCFYSDIQQIIGENISLNYNGINIKMEKIWEHVCANWDKSKWKLSLDKDPELLGIEIYERN